jgi:hypothetical protein
MQENIEELQYKDSTTTGKEQIVTKGAGVVRVGETAIAAEPRATEIREAGPR